jgi:hypothetical protein
VVQVRVQIDLRVQCSMESLQRPFEWGVPS